MGRSPPHAAQVAWRSASDGVALVPEHVSTPPALRSSRPVGGRLDAFFAACGASDSAPAIDEVAPLLDGARRTDAGRAAHRPAAAGAAPDPGWLDRYKLRWDLLIMRDVGDYSASRASFKREDACAPCARYGFDLPWRSRTTAATSTCSTEGIPCVYIHSGYVAMSPPTRVIRRRARPLAGYDGSTAARPSRISQVCVDSVPRS